LRFFGRGTRIHSARPRGGLRMTGPERHSLTLD
jgi:hypothetical protein